MVIGLFGFLVLLIKFSRLWLLKNWKLCILLIMVIVLFIDLRMWLVNLKYMFMVLVWMWNNRLLGVVGVVCCGLVSLMNGCSLVG